MLKLINVLATFSVGIGKDDVQEGVLLPEDWYTMEIVREPYEDKNSHWKAAGESLSFSDAHAINSKAGKNIVVPLQVESEIPEFSGRGFTKWLPLPNAGDEGLFMNDGQPKADWKAGVIHKWVEAFGGVAEGAEVSLGKGQKGFVYVLQESDNREGSDGKTVNAISMNVNPRALGGGESGSPLGDAGGGAPTLDGGGDEELPF